VLLVYAVGVYSRRVVVVETRAFTRRIADMLSPEEYRLFQLALVERPDLGKVIRGTGVSGRFDGRSGVAESEGEHE